MKILLLEDDIALNKSICDALIYSGYDVDTFFDGNDVIENLDKIYDLYIMDINVPNISGLELLNLIHNQTCQSKIIMISANTDINIIKNAYNLGCIDYLKKPFHLNELQLRINNIIKTRQINSMHKRLSKSYSFDLNTRTLLFNGESLTLNRRQLQVIELLAKNRANVVTFDMFRHYIWEDELISDTTIRSEIYRLKKNLKENFIKTIRNIGYIIERPD